MNFKPWHKASLAVAAGITLGAAFPALAAVGNASPPAAAVQLGSTATLVAKGAGVDVPVQVTCPSGDFGNLNVTLTERTGKDIAQAFGSTPVTCNGGAQNVVVPLTAQLHPFKTGTALGSASLFAFCFPSFCNASDSRTIKLTNK